MKTKGCAAAERMRADGVNCSGYGVLPKFPMLDNDLEIGAKALYAYFCSHRSQKGSVYPSRERILADLRINKDTYYRYLHQLTDNGYISVRQSKTGAFANNVYTIEMQPKKFSDPPKQAYLAKSYALIRAKGIEGAGRGAVPKSVMTDSRISVKAKAVYAYLCAFAGKENSASPKQENMLRHLGISYNSLNKYLRELRTYNLLLVSQRYAGGKLSINDYILVRNPDAAKAVTEHTVNAEGTQAHRTYSKPAVFYSEQLPEFPYAGNQDTGNQDAKSPDTNNNNRKTITEYNNKSSEQSIRDKTAEKGRAARASGLMEERKLSDEQIKETIAEAGALPYTLCADSGTVNAALRILTKSSRPTKTESRGERQRYELFLNALTEMLTTGREPTRIRGARLSYAKVVEALNSRISAGYDEWDEPYAEAFQLYEDVSCRFNRASAKAEIKNPLGYMKAMIWTELTTDMVETDNKINFDLAAGE